MRYVRLVILSITHTHVYLGKPGTHAQHPTHNPYPIPSHPMLQNWKKTTIELNHIIATHAKTLERLQKENKVNRRRSESSQTNINELQVTLGKIEMACSNLYNRIIDSRPGTRALNGQPLDEYKMLKVVSDAISDFSYVLNQFKQLPETEKQKALKNTT